VRLGPTELVIILIIVMLLFGAKRLPDLAGSIGTSMKEFRKATKDALEEDETRRRRRRLRGGLGPVLRSGRRPRALTAA